MKELRYDSNKRKRTVSSLPKNLLKKFVIIENRDSRGRVTFHISFKRSKRSKACTQTIPKEYRVHSSLLEAELAIFKMVKESNDHNFGFIRTESNIKKIIQILCLFRYNWDK